MMTQVLEFCAVPIWIVSPAGNNAAEEHCTAHRAWIHSGGTILQQVKNQDKQGDRPQRVRSVRRRFVIRSRCSPRSRRLFSLGLP